MSWSGSRAELIQNRLPLISILKVHKRREVFNWAKKEEPEIIKEIESCRKHEQERNQKENERFE